MAKNSKSRRFIAQGKNSAEKHAERFPYRKTFEEAEKLKAEAACSSTYRLE